MRKNNVLEMMERMESWKNAEKVMDYAETHKDGMGTTEYANLREMLMEIMQEKFSPKDCSQLENIAIKYVNKGFETEFRNMGMNKAQTWCHNAQLFRQPLWDYLQTVVPGLLDYKLKVRRPTSYDYEMARQVFPPMEERRSMHGEDKEIKPSRDRVEYAGGDEEAEEPEFEEPEAEEVKLEIDREVLERQKRDIEEELENEIKRMKSNTNMAQRDALLSAKEYDLLRRIPHVRIQYMGREGKNMIVRIFAQTEAQIEQTVNKITEEAEEKRQSKMTREKAREDPYAPLTFEKVETILCAKYHSRFRYQCPKAIQSLAKRIARYLYAHHLSYDSPGVGIDTIDIFLVSNPTYIFSSEHANDVFNAWVRDRTLGELEEANSTPCDEEIKYDNIVKLLALDKLEKTEGMDEMEQYRRKELLDELMVCGFSYDAMTTWLLEADIFFKSMGSTVGDQLNFEYAEFMKIRNRRQNEY